MLWKLMRENGRRFDGTREKKDEWKVKGIRKEENKVNEAEEDGEREWMEVN